MCFDHALRIPALKLKSHWSDAAHELHGWISQTYQALRCEVDAPGVDSVCTAQCSQG